MIAPRLVHLIESHSEQLTHGLVEKLQRCERLPDLKNIPDDEFRHRVHEIYHNLGEWLLSKTEADIEGRYTVLGARRAAQGVALSQLVWAILIVKEHLWEFLKREGLVDRPVELYQELELFQLTDQFFDRAVYYAIIGYERSAGTHGHHDSSPRAA